MSKLTVYQKVHEGYEANQARDEIIKVLDSHHISLLTKMAILDLMALELKLKAGLHTPVFMIQ